LKSERSNFGIYRYGLIPHRDCYLNQNGNAC